MGYRNLIIEIKEPLVDSAHKFQKALEILGKATKTKFTLDHKHTVEPTPYKALRELTDEIHIQTQDQLYQLMQAISKTWLGLELKKAKDTDLFLLNGKVFINPKTGKQLTIGQWKSIQKDLTKIFNNLYGQSQDKLIKQAMAMGKILQGMDASKRLTVGLDALDINLHTDVVTADTSYKHMMAWANVHTGELITDMTNRSRRKVVERLMEGFRDKSSSKELQEALFEDFSVLNKDWRRIVETETATNFNNGYLKAELNQAKARNKDEPVFMLGISGAGACSFCAGEVDGQTFVLLEDAPGTGDKVMVDGTEYTAIWPGKSNVGRSRKDWWVSAGAQHPHCRCTFSYIDKNIYEYEQKLRDAMLDD